MGQRSYIEAGLQRGTGRVGQVVDGTKRGTYQADTAEAPAKRLIKNGAIEGQLLKVALRQPYVSW